MDRPPPPPPPSAAPSPPAPRMQSRVPRSLPSTPRHGSACVGRRPSTHAADGDVELAVGEHVLPQVEDYAVERLYAGVSGYWRRVILTPQRGSVQDIGIRGMGNRRRWSGFFSRVSTMTVRDEMCTTFNETFHITATKYEILSLTISLYQVLDTNVSSKISTP